MKDYQKIYSNKLISIEKAVGMIKSDTDIIVAQCASEPQGCMEKFHLMKDKVQDVKVFSVLTLNHFTMSYGQLAIPPKSYTWV